jgi:hypothetical protein
MATVNANIPAIDYTSKDYNGFITSMLSYAKTVFPEWTNQNPGSLEVMLMESFAREMDVLSYYGDRILAESYIGTATQLASVIQLAELLGYIPSQPQAATGTVTFQTATGGPAVSVPKGTQVTTAYITSLNAPITFETQATVTVPGNGGTVVANVAQGVTQGSTQFTIGSNTLSPTLVTMELLGSSDGSSFQQFSLANNPVVGGSITVYVQNPLYNTTTTGVDQVVAWTNVTSLMSATSSDPSWSYTVDDQNIITVHFGDNVNGAIPAAGLNIYANYRVGGGSIGNLGINQINDIASPITGVTIASSTATTGGVDRESIDQIRNNAPKAFTAQDRAVTAQDFSNLAITYPGIAQAGTLATTSTNVQVYATANGNVTPSQALLDGLQVYLQSKAMIGQVVSTSAASRIEIAATLTVGISPLYDPSTVSLQVTQAIQNLLAPANVTLGMRLPVSKAYSTVMSVPGVIYTNITVWNRSGGGFTLGDIYLQVSEIPFIATNLLITPVVTTT